MSLLTNRRSFLPAYLTFGTLLCALPVLADAPAVGTAKPQMLILQNVVPRDILKALHWNQNAQRFDSAAPIRVEGVTRIGVLPLTNSLSVVATPDGFTKLRTLVRILDVVPRQVGIKFATADATEADLKASGISFDLVPALDLGRAALLRYSTSENVAAFLQTLTKRGAITQAPVITTTNNVAATITLSTTLSSQAVLSETFAVTPRVNSNDSVTLDLHLVLLNGTAKREMKTLRTVKSGDTMVIVMPPIGSAAGKSFLLFVTPTIISTDKGPATMMVK